MRVPYIINCERHFRNIRLATKGMHTSDRDFEQVIPYCFKLEADIVLNGDWETIQPKFYGSLNGGGHFVTYNMTLTQGKVSASDYHGLFGFVAYGGVGEVFSNLVLKDCKIQNEDIGTQLTNGKSQYSHVDIGILAGTITGGEIRNVTIENPTIDCNVNNSLIGGISGNFDGTAYNCNVSGGSLTSYSGDLGGMAGSAYVTRFHGGRCATTLTKYHYVEGDRIGPVVGNSTETGSVDASAVVMNKNADQCIAEGTLITLADGRQVPVESLTGDELLLVWNLHTGRFDTAPVVFVDCEPRKAYSVIKLTFSDGTEVKVISEHGFWDYDLNQYVYLDKNAASYIGHWFNKQATDENGEMISRRVQLTGVAISEEETTPYSPVTYAHLCYYVNGMLSMPGGIGGLFNTFEVDAETMRYDEARMAEDIARYGLFTYEEFCEMVPVSREMFEAFNGQYLKVAMGKGLVSEQTLKDLVARYAVLVG